MRYFYGKFQIKMDIVMFQKKYIQVLDTKTGITDFSLEYSISISNVNRLNHNIMKKKEKNT